MYLAYVIAYVNNNVIAYVTAYCKHSAFCVHLLCIFCASFVDGVHIYCIFYAY